MKKIEIDSLSGLAEVARAVVESLDGRNIVLLNGEMGAGKTTLVSAIAAELGSDDSVSSPTFAIVNEYLGRDDRRIYHFDMYRINSIAEALDFGVEEYLASSDLCLIEWAQRIEPLLPQQLMMVNIEVLSPEKRLFTIE